MHCPHCTVTVFVNPTYIGIYSPDHFHGHEDAPKDRYGVNWDICPNCGNIIINLVANRHMQEEPEVILIYPRTRKRKALPDAVAKDIAADFNEASEVLDISPKASAALSRRLLQRLLVDYGKVKKKDLAPQIEEVLPSYLGQTIDSIRAIGNFAAHPLKSQDSGLVLDVEPGEAEITLEAVSMAIDFYIVQPAIATKKRDVINAKLKEAGRPPLK